MDDTAKERPDQKVPNELDDSAILPPERVIKGDFSPLALLIPLGGVAIVAALFFFALRLHISYVRSQARQAIELEQIELSQRAFLESVKAGTMPLIEKYLKAGLDPLEADNRGRNSLFFAIERGNSKILEQILKEVGRLPETTRGGQLKLQDLTSTSLIELGCNSPGAPLQNLAAAKGSVVSLSLIQNYTDNSNPLPKEELSPVSCAALANNATVVEWLLGRGAGIDRIEANGRTALGNAAAASARSVVQLLLERGADPFIQESHGETAIFDAARSGDEAIVTLLLKREFDLNKVNYKGEKAWQVAESANNPDIVPLLHPEYLLYAGLTKENPSIVDFATRRGARINVSDRDGITPLHVALSGGRPAQYRFLIRSQAGVSFSGGDSPVRSDTESLIKQLEVVRRLERRLASKDGPYTQGEDEDTLYSSLKAPPILLEEIDRGRKPFLPDSVTGAIREDRAALVEYLLHKGADVNGADLDGNTPLHFATLRAEPKLISQILEKGADYERTNKQGITPLLLAIRQKHPEIAILFLQKGQPRNIDLNLERGLISAVETGQNGIAERLLQLKLSPELKDAADRSLVLIALSQNNYELAEILHRFGAKIDLTDAPVQSLYLYAKRKKVLRLINFLEKFGTGLDKISVPLLQKQIDRYSEIQDRARAVQ